MIKDTAITSALYSCILCSVAEILNVTAKRINVKQSIVDRTEDLYIRSFY